MKKLVFLLVLFLLPAFSTSLARSVSYPDSREYKVLLEPENFVSVKKGCELFWALVEKVAKDHGFTAKKEIKTSPDRKIRFIDTQDFGLNKKGFLLRQRTSQDKDELTLKFRASDVESTMVAPIEPDKEYDDDVSGEIDVVVKLGQPVSIYSRSGKINECRQIPNSVADLLKYYPGMRIVGLKPELELQTVNHITIDEKRILHGKIDFGKSKSKALFSVWYIQDSSTPMIAEFSFKIKTEDYKLTAAKNSINRIDAFFVDLVKRGKLFISPHQTKTGMVYHRQTDD